MNSHNFPIDFFHLPRDLHLGAWPEELGPTHGPSMTLAALPSQPHLDGFESAATRLLKHTIYLALGMLTIGTRPIKKESFRFSARSCGI